MNTYWSRLAGACALAGAFACGAPSSEPVESSSGGAVAPIQPARATGPMFSEMLMPLGAHQSQEELMEIARFIRRWSEDPYGEVPENDTSLSTHAAMLAWVTESPDVHVRICAMLSMMANQEGSGGDPGAATTAGQLFGMSAYLIEHPGADPHSAAVQVHGMELALRWYQAAVGAGTLQPNSFIDELAARASREGGLAGWYEQRQIRCGDGTTGAGAPEVADPLAAESADGTTAPAAAQPSRQEVATLFGSAADAVGACLTATGMVTVQAVFRGSDGQLTSIAVHGAQSPEERACVTNVLEQRLRVQPFAREDFTVNFPFRVRR